MKELSIEEKVHRYDEAINKAKSLYKASEPMSGCNVLLETLFPELKESKEERIRKVIYGWICTQPSQFFDSGFSKEEMLAWLEKQGNNMNCIYDKELSELLHIVIRRFINDPNISYSDREKVSIKVLPYVELLEKQGEGIDYVNKEYWRGYREGKQEILDKYAELEKQCKNNMGISESVKQKLEDNLSKALEKETPESWNEFLDEQGEHKHKIQPKFKIGDIIRFKGNETLKGETETHKIVSYDNELYVFDDGTTDLFCEQDLYELVEQKPAWSEEAQEEQVSEEFINALDTMLNDGLPDRYLVSEERIKKSAELLFSIARKQLKIEMQEWNKEDENNISFLTSIIEECFKDKEKITLYSDTVCAHFTKEDVIDRLNSLRPKTTWKPSEEQIEVLEHFVRSIGESGYASPYDNNTKLLYSLLSDLKKLK